MRSDIAKLTTEKERRGSSSCASKKYGGKIHIVHNQEHDYEDEFGGFYSSARHRHQNNKSFSDVLSPIRGALRKNVGRPWDDVYSEFCQFLDRRSVSGIHIFDHLCGRGGEVTTKGLYVEDGKVYEYPAGGYFGRRALYYGKGLEVDGFYVHPKTGILCYKAPNYGGHHGHLKAVLKSLRENEIDIEHRKYRVINGCWFEIWEVEGVKEDWRPCYIKSKLAEDHVGHRWRQCVQHKKTGEWGEWHLTKTMVVDKKRSLNSKEIKMVKKYQSRRIKELEEELM